MLQVGKNDLEYLFRQLTGGLYNCRIDRSLTDTDCQTVIIAVQTDDLFFNFKRPQGFNDSEGFLSVSADERVNR